MPPRVRRRTARWREERFAQIVEADSHACFRSVILAPPQQRRGTPLPTTSLPFYSHNFGGS